MKKQNHEVLLRQLPDFSAAVTEQIQQFAGVELAGSVGAIKERVGEIALVLVQGHNLFFDAPLHHQAIDSDRPLLTDAVGAV